MTITLFKQGHRQSSVTVDAQEIVDSFLDSEYLHIRNGLDFSILYFLRFEEEVEINPKDLRALVSLIRRSIKAMNTSTPDQSLQQN